MRTLHHTTVTMTRPDGSTFTHVYTYAHLNVGLYGSHGPAQGFLLALDDEIRTHGWIRAERESRT